MATNECRVAVASLLPRKLCHMDPLSAFTRDPFTGTITDEDCGRADHTRMKMGPTDAACVLACISAHSGSYVLYDGKDVYTLSDQRTPEKFAGQKVTVVGTLDARTKTIQVDSIAAAR